MAHLVSPARTVKLAPALPYLAPTTTISPALSTPTFPLKPPDTTAASKLVSSVKLPAALLPHVKTTPEVPKDRLSLPAIPTTLESDCHVVASLPVCATRKAPLLSTVPAPLPSTTTNPPLPTFTRPSPPNLAVS